jgi:hypothetical protein
MGGSVRQCLGLGWDLEVRGSTYRLDYRTSTQATAILEGRVDNVTSYGGGVGYGLSNGARVAFYVDEYKRTSPTLTFRGYNGLRFGLTVTVGL